MSRYDSYSSYSRFPKYVSVAERKAKAYKTAAKMKKADLSPVVLSSSKISTTFWGKAWCDNVESYQDYENRLPRGRSYVRSGAVIDLKIAKGSVTALVCGSGRTPYKIDITIKPLEATRWDALKKQCIGKIDSLVSLVQGKLSKDTLALFCDPDTGLFPESFEIKMKCSCPDSAGLCKHLAAVLYGIGARLDDDPKLFFTLRGIDENELINADVVGALTEGVTSEIDDDALSAIFGVDFDTLSTPAPAKTKPTPKRKPGSPNLEGETVASHQEKVSSRELPVASRELPVANEGGAQSSRQAAEGQATLAPPSIRTLPRTAAKRKPAPSALEGETVASRQEKVSSRELPVASRELPVANEGGAQSSRQAAEGQATLAPPSIRTLPRTTKTTPSQVDAASSPRSKPASKSQSVKSSPSATKAKRTPKG